MGYKKIVIYEDEVDSLISRFSNLTKEHNIFVYITGAMWDALEITSYRKQIEEGGFNLSEVKGVPYANRIGNVDWGEEYVEIPKADVYFTDGLQGNCFHILGKLPNEKAYLITGDDNLAEKAREEGYQTLGSNEDLERIVHDIK